MGRLEEPAQILSDYLLEESPEEFIEQRESLTSYNHLSVVRCFISHILVQINIHDTEQGIARYDNLRVVVV